MLGSGSVVLIQIVDTGQLDCHSYMMIHLKTLHLSLNIVYISFLGR